MKSAKKAQSPRLQSKLKVQVFDANSQRTSKAKVRVTEDKRKRWTCASIPPAAFMKRLSLRQRITR
jgi:hypothetical protein